MQFKIKTLFGVITGVAILCCIVFVLPDWVAALMFTIGPIFLCSGVLAAGIYCDGNVRAFAIGCGPPSVLWSLSITGRALGFGFGFGFGEEYVLVLALCGLLVITVVSGLIAVAVRAWALRQASKPKTPLGGTTPKAGAQDLGSSEDTSN